MPKDDQPEKSVAILACPGVTMLDLVGTHSMLGGLGMAKYKSFIVAPDKSPVQSDTPLKIVPDKSFAELSNPTILVVVGGGLGWLKALGDTTLLEYVSRVAPAAESPDLDRHRQPVAGSCRAAQGSNGNHALGVFRLAGGARRPLPAAALGGRWADRHLRGRYGRNGLWLEAGLPAGGREQRSHAAAHGGIRSSATLRSRRLGS